MEAPPKEANISDAKLPESRKQSLFPAFCIECPAHSGFAFFLLDLRPQRAIAVIGGHVQAIHDGHASGQFALSFDLDIVRTPLSSDRWIERNAHGNRIGQRYPVFSRLDLVSLARLAVALDGEMSDCIVESENAGHIAFSHDRVSAAKVPAD